LEPADENSKSTHHPPIQSSSLLCANSVAEIKLRHLEIPDAEHGRGLTLATAGMPVKAADGAAANRAAQASFLRNIVEFSLEMASADFVRHRRRKIWN